MKPVTALLPLTWAALVVTLTGCAAESQTELVVLAATSLTEVMTTVEVDFERANPGVDVVVSLGPSSSLVTQVIAGAPVDVLISAGEGPIADLEQAGQIAGEAVVVARNSPVLVVPAGNPGNVAELADLADPRLLVGLCAVEVPCGTVAVDLLARAGVNASVDTQERDARAVLTKVRLGELDAGIVFATDALSAGSDVEVVPVPGATEVQSEYSAVVVAQSPQPGHAAAFLEYLQGRSARETFAATGFGPP